MDKIFDIYLAKADQTESDACAALSLPATPYEIQDAFDKLRLAEGEALYWEITEYHAFEELPSILNDSCGLYELNALAQKLSELDEQQCTAFAGLLQMEQRKGGPIPASRLIDLAYSTACCHVVDEALNDFQLGRFCAENGFVPGVEELPDAVFDLLDFERIGRKHRQRGSGVLVERSADHPGGYVEQHDSLVEAYKNLDLTLKQPDYSLLLHVARGYYAPPVSDCEKSVQLKLPADHETLETVLSSLKVNDWQETVWYGLDCRVPALANMIYDIGVHDSFHIAWMDRLNCLAQQMVEMDTQTLNTYKALLETVNCKDIQSANQLMDTLDQYIFSPQFSSPIEVARGELSAALTKPEVEMIAPHLNLYQYGQALVQKRNGSLTPYGLLERRDGQPIQAMEDQPQWGGMELK